MRMYDIIARKRDGKELTKEEIEYFVTNYTNGKIPDYQASALTMAIYLQKMTPNETAALTLAMAHSGDIMNLERINGIKVDKHSTGGVGDKTSLIIGPMVAALGVPVAKMSGRGLGHTGGTIDKLESIPNFVTSISENEFFENINRIGIAFAGQTGNLAPADKKLYALRDVTATVENISLIASSIMSKKIAAGADVIVLDVKCGSGAFMKTEESALELAKEMVKIGSLVKRHTCAIISDMEQPLGFAVGNALEVEEAINTLKGEGPKDLLELSIELAAHMVAGAKVAASVTEAKAMLNKVLSDGSALNKLAELIEAQHGNPEVVNNTSLLPKALIQYEFKADTEGYVSHIACEQVGIAAMVLGAGRETKEDVIDPSVGIVLKKKVGDYVHVGDTLAVFHANDENRLADSIKRFKEVYGFSQEKVESPELIKYIIT